MADELISREAVLDEAERDSNFRLVVPVETIEKVPSVDAVEVVRCRDCLFKQSPKRYGNLQCKILGVPMRNNDFCSYGERKSKNE